MSIEILTILASFQTFQDKILQLELVSSTLSCGLLVQKLLAYLEDKSDPPLDSESNPQLCHCSRQDLTRHHPTRVLH